MQKIISKKWQLDDRQVKRRAIRQARKNKVTRQAYHFTEQGQNAIPVYPKPKLAGIVA